MKKRKKIQLMTPEEWAAWDKRGEELREAIRRLEIELATGVRPPRDESLRKAS
jgi:hypothetical protein